MRVAVGWGISNDYTIMEPGNYNKCELKTNMPFSTQAAISPFLLRYPH